ncbi:TFIIH subunit Tfb4/p34 [Jimgerdemannia flammicorona]|uniref:General transcription and DNA repair factor IIH subunit TFB4 n=1 Tax=Jimgerdemannia flammicorona TaxID=994334 RepID=A0A433QAY4_9FUNG|nr:TFIIH subunit Tfb4/p34 [Jimgerdemannia flammicorona]
MKDTTTSEDDSNLLVIIVDTNPFVWSAAPLPLNDALCQILLFINAHLSLKHDNKLAVIASHVGVSKFLYPITDDSEIKSIAKESRGTKDANVYPNFKIVNDQVTAGLKKLFKDVDTPQAYQDKARYETDRKGSSHNFPLSAGTSMISGSLSMALCYINRITKSDDLGRIKPRILAISVSPDSAFQYIPIMNCIFSAQKSSIPVDVCKVFGEDTVFLQQAAHITSGIYLKVEDPQSLLQYLMFTFLPDRYSRNYLCLPGQDQVDFRAACFCHKRIIDIGYVCSVCLSIFCDFSPVCSTCKTKFPIPGKTVGMIRSRSNVGTPKPVSASTPTSMS